MAENKELKKERQRRWLQKKKARELEEQKKDVKVESEKKDVEAKDEKKDVLEEEQKKDDVVKDEKKDVVVKDVDEKHAQKDEKESDKEIVEVKEKKKKKTTTPVEYVKIDPIAFAKFSVGIETLTLQARKDKILKEGERLFIEASARSVAEVYDVPKMIVLAQYIASMVMPHATRSLDSITKKNEVQMKILIRKMKSDPEFYNYLLNQYGSEQDIVENMELATADLKDYEKKKEKRRVLEELKSELKDVKKEVEQK